MSDTNSYVIKNVDALYPKINQTYKFDRNAGANGKSVPCDPSLDGAAYSLNFKMSQDQAKELYNAMNQSFVNADRRTDKWDKKLAMPFHKEEAEGEAIWIGKTTLKGAYNKQLTTPPKQFDSKNTALPDDLLLTSNSTVNISGQFVPYGPSDRSDGGGVSLRLRAVQVIAYVPMADRSPFDVVTDGFDSGGAIEKPEPSADELFPAEEAPAPKQEAVSDDVFEEPKVKKSNSKPEPKPKNDDDLGALLDEFDD